MDWVIFGLVHARCSGSRTEGRRYGESFQIQITGFPVVLVSANQLVCRGFLWCIELRLAGSREGCSHVRNIPTKVLWEAILGQDSLMNLITWEVLTAVRDHTIEVGLCGWSWALESPSSAYFSSLPELLDCVAGLAEFLISLLWSRLWGDLGIHGHYGDHGSLIRSLWAQPHNSHRLDLSFILTFSHLRYSLRWEDIKMCPFWLCDDSVITQLSSSPPTGRLDLLEGSIPGPGVFSWGYHGQLSEPIFINNG